MVKEEIAAGLKNAMERGQTLDQAAQSFINAGYARDDVQEAKDYLMGSVNQSLPQAPMKPSLGSSGQQATMMPRTVQGIQSLPTTTMMSSAPTAPPESMPINRLPSIRPERKESGRTALIIIVILLLLIFIGALGYLVYYLAT